MKIAVVITCHNRKLKTLACLEALYNCKLSEGYAFEVFLVDDGSTDGTGEAVRTNYPKVNVIQANGNLYWNRGMHLAWKTASAINEYHYYLWLNDDTQLYSNALEVVINSSIHENDCSIICGATCSKASNKVTYSGFLLSHHKLLKPNGTNQPCDIFHGNFVLIPKAVFKEIGNLDWKFRHAIGDFDYGLRAKKTGIKCFIAPEFVGTCESNPTLPKWCLSSTPLIKRFKLLYSPLGYAEPIPFFIYEKRHFGLPTAIKHFLSINLRAFIPYLWKQKQ
jgi:GT2 family glycosyltransferase